MAQTTVITGANRGIGAALHARAAKRGTSVGTARAASGDLISLDVTNPADVASLPERIAPQSVDLLVCNAGVFLEKGLSPADYTPELWAQSFAVNVTGVFLTVQAMLPKLRAANSAKIAIISSQMASHTLAPGNNYIYRASKAAVLNVGRNLAAELADEGIAVGIYHPGWVRTDMGGPGGEIDVDSAADGLMSRFDALSINTTGCFETWDGRAHAY